MRVRWQVGTSNNSTSVGRPGFRFTPGYCPPHRELINNHGLDASDDRWNKLRLAGKFERGLVRCCV
jgi:hypothetical protein